MKRTIHIQTIIALAALLTASCAQNGETASQPEGTAAGVTLLGTAGEDRSPAAGAETRTDYEDSENTIQVTWTAGDRIGVHTEVNGQITAANYGYRAGSAGTTTLFSYLSEQQVVDWQDETSPHDFYAYYPWNESAAEAGPHAQPVTLAAEQQLNSSDPLAHLAALDFMYGSATGQTRQEVGAFNPVPIHFKHLFSILEVRIRGTQYAMVEAVKFRCTDESEAVSLGEGSTVDLATGEITPAQTSPEIVLTGNQNTQIGGYITYQMMITPGHAGREFEIVAQVNGNDYVIATRQVPETGIQPGRTLVVSADLTVAEEDTYPTVNLSEKGCANTYYVNRPGELYKFRADVKGNGKALTLGGLSYTEEDLKIEPKRALILWYDCVQTNYSPWVDRCPIVKSSVQLLEDGYVYFSTPAEFVNGNVVIFVIDQDLDYDEIQVDANRQLTNARILWSWNLVCSEGYDPDEAQNQIVAQGYTFMNRDLGAVIDLEDAWIDGARNDVAVTSVNGNRYQFGRKDPRPHIPDYKSLQVNYMTGLCYTAAYTPVPALGLSFDMKYDRGHMENQLFLDGGAGTWIDIESALGSDWSNMAHAQLLAAGNPHLWIYKKNGQWLSNTTTTKAVWGTLDDTTPEQKTIYDPCPAGWKVAGTAAWKALLSDLSQFTISTSFDRGYQFGSASFFPFNGGISNTQGANGGAYIGSCGATVSAAYLTSGPLTDTGKATTCELIGNANYKAGDVLTDVSYGETVNASGAAVRCVKIAEN